MGLINHKIDKKASASFATRRFKLKQKKHERQDNLDPHLFSALKLSRKSQSPILTEEGKVDQDTLVKMTNSLTSKRTSKNDEQAIHIYQQPVVKEKY